MVSKYDIELIQTSLGCPEQYDAFIGRKLVGYIRLRYGHLTVECPNCGGEEVYSAHPEGDGIFEYEERDKYLDASVTAIADWVNKNG